MEWLEEYPCIFDLGNWILRTALKDIGRIRDKIPHFFVIVNISAAQLSRKEFRDSVMTILKETGARPEELCLELTERCRDLDVTFLKNEVNFFHSKGIKIALDDFGTGYSNFDRILSLKLDVVKFDRSLLLMADQDANSRFMLDYFSTAFERLGYKVLYEGVETDAQEELCIISHADYLQGYKFSKPIPIEELPRFLTRG